MTKTAVIFPGQGSQSVGMGRDLVDASPAAKDVFDRAREVLGFNIAKTCFEGPAERLEQTDIQQPAIFVVSVALWEAFLEAGLQAGTASAFGSRSAFIVTGGLSLGEYTALYVAGAVGFEDCLKLVQRRGQFMQGAAEAAPGGMVSLIGVDEDAAKAVCDKARGDDVLAPANFNCPGQVVISGSQAACDRAVEAADEAGQQAGSAHCRAIALPVAGAFHSPLMASAAEGLWPVLQETHFTEPGIPVIANVSGERHAGVGAIRDSLRKQVTQPVLWQRCVERMMAMGVVRFVEVGPGRVLTGMMRKIDRQSRLADRKMTAINVSTFESIAKALAQLDDA